MSNGISANAQPTDSFATIPDVPVAPTTDRVSPNQMAIGNTRGAIITPGSDGKPQVLQGNQPKFGNGLFVAKPGFDVTTNTDPANFIFNSNQNTFKIVQSSSTTVTIPAGYSAGTYDSLVTNTLTKYPYVVSSVIPPYVLATDKYTLQTPAWSVVGGVVKWLSYVTVGTGYIDFVIDLQAISLTGVVGVWTFNYYILQETSG